ncbi:MAG: T9SS type A sorting domain-containing protein [Chlorobi bacterium]|nr:T9SS type A sorting domain-containing protein [Chlorobiota bacterium]
MKRVYFLLSMVLLISVAVVAQPTITYENAPKIGDVYYQSYFTTSLDPGPGGASQTWDYGSVQAEGTDQFSVISPSGTPFENQFPEANITFYVNNETGEIYSYADLSTSEILSYGAGIVTDTGNLIMHYSDPEKQMEFPFSFNDSFTDDYFAVFEVIGMTIHRRGTSTVTADAWGSITTPETTYGSVLRIKNESNIVDSVFMGSIFLMARTSSSTDYSWYTGDDGYPVFTITISQDEESTDTTGSFKTTPESVGENTNNLSNIRVYPNPANNILYVSIPSENEDDLIISLLDLTGKEIIRKNHDFSAQRNPVTLDLNNLSPGMYFLRVNDGQHSFTKKIIVE